MKYYFHTLVWEKTNMTELDAIADYTFDNGINIRLCTGSSAETNILFPYEMNINHPVKGHTRISYLDKSNVNFIMFNLDNEIIEQFKNSISYEKNSEV